MCIYFFQLLLFSDQKWVNNQEKTIPCKRDLQVKILLRKLARSDRSNWYGTWILWFCGIWGVLNWGVSELLWIWVGRWPHQDSMGKISAPSSTPCSLPGWSHLTCLLCASQFPMSCAIKAYPWNRIIVKNMVKYFHLTNHCVFPPWYTNPGSKTWPMLTHLTLNTSYYC